MTAQDLLEKLLAAKEEGVDLTTLTVITVHTSWAEYGGGYSDSESYPQDTKINLTTQEFIL
jgi:hypothetical protein